MTKKREEDVHSWIATQLPQGKEVEFSVIIPAYNEYRRLPVTLMEIIDYLDHTAITYEIIVVDDGSHDNTAELVLKFEKIRPQVTLIRLPKNYGKGHAVKLGMLNAHGRQIVFADADGATPFAEIAKLRAALDQGAEIAIGSRAIFAHDTKVVTRWYRKYLGRIFNTVVNLVLLPGIRDTQCGFKLFTFEAAQCLFKLQQSDGFGFDVEILYLAKKTGFRVQEVPINWNNVPGSKVNLVTDSLKMLRDIFIFRLRHRTVSPEVRSAQAS